MASDVGVQVPPDSTGKVVRTRQVVENATNVQQQVIEIAGDDGTLVGVDSGTGRLSVNDQFQGGQTLPDQSGANGVLTFTFSSAVDLVVVYSLAQVSRADPFGGTPSATQGVYCDSGVATFIPVVCTTLKVYAVSGATVSVWGFRY